MNRRNALKGIGLSIGYTLTTSTVVSMLQSCKTEEKLWEPVFFTKDESAVITKLIDLILPSTQKTPGALDVNVPEFIDTFIFKTYNIKQQKKYRDGLAAIIDALPITNMEVHKLSTDDYTTLLDKYLKINKKQRLIYQTYNEDEDPVNKDAIIFKALDNLRNTSVWAYKTSEQIGENVLAYDPVPGLQMGCIPLDEATEGKAWSL